MIPARMFLFVLLLVSVHAFGAVQSSRDDCHEVTTPEALRFRDRAERLFLAYTNNAVKSYEIGTMDCGSELVVVVIPTGNDAAIGSIVTISYSKDDKHITISPGM